MYWEKETSKIIRILIKTIAKQGEYSYESHNCFRSWWDKHS